MRSGTAENVQVARWPTLMVEMSISLTSMETRILEMSAICASEPVSVLAPVEAPTTASIETSVPAFGAVMVSLLTSSVVSA